MDEAFKMKVKFEDKTANDGRYHTVSELVINDSKTLENLMDGPVLCDSLHFCSWES